MAFFNAFEEESQSPSVKTGPLFRQEGGPAEGTGGSHLSLSAYISQHLSGEGTGQASSASPGIPTPAERRGPAAPAGQFLNTLDVNLTAGLEQYLPTPIFRLRVMKKRLADEIAELRMKLNKYERLPDASAELQGRMDMIRRRVEMLEAHERQVDEELRAMLRPGVSASYGLNRLTGQLGKLLVHLGGAAWGLASHLIYGPAYGAMQAAAQELHTLQEVFADRLNDPGASDAEISQLLTRYEQAVRRQETAALQLKPFSFR